MSALARASGVQTGLRRGGVLMVAPDARIYERSPEREAEALQAVAMALLQYTPLVAAAEEATLLIDIGASLRLFGGIAALCRRIRANLCALGFTASLSCAPTARGAWLLARHGGGRCLSMASLTRRLDRLRPCCCCRRGPLLPGSKGSAASAWPTCAACPGPACSGAAAGPCSTRSRPRRPRLRSCSPGSG